MEATLNLLKHIFMICETPKHVWIRMNCAGADLAAFGTKTLDQQSSDARSAALARDAEQAHAL
jgi:hypothetical protein